MVPVPVLTPVTTENAMHTLPTQDMSPSQQAPPLLKKPMGHVAPADHKQDNQTSTAEVSTSTGKATPHKTKHNMHATVTASVNAHGTESASTTDMGGVTKSAESSSTAVKGLETGSASTSATSTTGSAAPPQATDDKGGVVATKDLNGSFGGCIEVGAGLDVNAGADADFFGLFNPSTKVNLFSKKFQIFKVRLIPFSFNT